MENLVKLNEIKNNNGEYAKLLDNNQKLYNIVYSSVMDNQYDYLNEILDPIRDGVRYHIDLEYGGGNYIEVRDIRKFVEGMQDVQICYGILDEEQAQKIVEAMNMLEKLDELDVYSKQYGKLEDDILSKSQVIASYLLEQVGYVEIDDSMLIDELENCIEWGYNNLDNVYCDLETYKAYEYVGYREM